MKTILTSILTATLLTAFASAAPPRLAGPQRLAGNAHRQAAQPPQGSDPSSITYAITTGFQFGTFDLQIGRAHV